MHFKLLCKDKASSARRGIIETDHGSIQTPVFMPVGTVGAVKGLHVKDLKEELGAQIILGNTYHLYLRPGLEVLESAGGLHSFNSWDRPILTDSGGYQIFSLAHRRKIKEEGVTFQSHIDGSRHLFTPEKVIDIQRIIGGDIIMALDECPPYPCEKSYVASSLEITNRWLKRCFDHFHSTGPVYGHHQSLFPIVQGGVHHDLRKKSAEEVSLYEADGNAIGGLSVGEPPEMMYEITALVCGILPANKPRYLMGVGTPVNLLECIALGIDMFDCVMPTRNGRNGMLFTRKGIMNMKNEKWKNDHTALDEDGHSFVDLTYSKAFVRHLFVSSEMLGPMIATIHNLGFYFSLMEEARQHIENDDFYTWKEMMVNQLQNRL
ncbi:MAG: tRNA guanosine(34) transglycosylase Tgt [Bacteroidetes bacterium]|nr:tRNA guanosine(34) transglycosylase Tgt [Bacteroidota bacterium]